MPSKPIRYCNECPFRHWKKSWNDDVSISCFAPYFLDIGENFKLENKEYLIPPKNCALNIEKIIIEKETQTPPAEQKENRLLRVDE